MTALRKGQRWISESEPELGLGTVVQVGDARVGVQFPASGELRQYAIDNAPLARVRFRKGDVIRTREGNPLTVESVREEDGLITYVGEGQELPEAKLNDRISIHGPEDRLLRGQVDEFADFDLRRRTLTHLHRYRRSAVRGFVGGRIDLIPHQLYIAHAVSSRQAPRVLLSDEVGLGKTIEACLILHRLLLSGRAARVLILVPESLVHQWFVEMLRKFNTWLHIFDEERCAAIESGQPGANPFLDDQLILCSLDFLAASVKRATQAEAAEWDVLVVDEAHLLEWSPEGASGKYALVESLSRRAEGLLLLTATPEQLGQESHFARLRLLDPDRYGNIDAFKQEAGEFKPVADVIERLRAGKRVTKKDATYLRSHFPRESGRFTTSIEAVGKGDEKARKALLTDLLDLHGPGRVVFRNTRAAMSGFPKRKAHLTPVPVRRDRAEWLDRVSMEFAIDAGDADLQGRASLLKDPRVPWLASLLRELSPAKVLLICRSPEKAVALEQALRAELEIKAAVFHEKLTLVQRDRNAAWFAEEEGARILICSEIGSEGRNFQFAHHLVLFDLPLNPELLEQRIGRLDRIGQTEDIHIHVPYLKGSPQDVLSRWYHEGLDAFESSLEGANELLRQFGRQVHDLALEYPALSPGEASGELTELLERTTRARVRLGRQLEQGRDRLLELNSYRPEVAEALVEGIRREDQDAQLEEFMLDVFDRFGVHLEELADRTYRLGAQGVITDAFPAIPEEGMVATFDRSRALGREDVGFLSWDHPMVTGVMDLILGSGKGNSAFAVWPDPNDRTLLLELLFVLETVSEGRLHVDRFLPATPLRIVMNQESEDVTRDHPETALEGAIRKGNPYALTDRPELTQNVLPAMIAAAKDVAEEQARSLIEEGFQSMSELLDHEIDRLKTLREVNDHIRPREIELAERQRADLAEAIRGARVRLDAVRLIWKGPPEALR